MEKHSVNKKEVLEEIVRLFVVKRKHSRFLDFINSAKNYEAFLDELLNDTRNFKPEYLTELLGIEHTPERILLNLKKLGAGKKAYIVSTNDETDGMVGELEKILSLVHDEDLVYCLNSRLAYYAGHSGWHYILKAK